MFFLGGGGVCAFPLAQVAQLEAQQQSIVDIVGPVWCAHHIRYLPDWSKTLYPVLMHF